MFRTVVQIHMLVSVIDFLFGLNIQKKEYIQDLINIQRASQNPLSRNTKNKISNLFNHFEWENLIKINYRPI